MKSIEKKDSNLANSTHKLKLLILFLGIFLFVNPISVLAQQVDRPGFRPGRIDIPEPKPLQPEKKLDLRIPEGGKAFGEELDKIKLVLKEVDIQGVTVFSKDELKVFYQDMLGQEIPLSKIYLIEEKITQKYRQAGYILSRALIPRQRVRDGVVQILVVEGYIDQVNIEGAEKMQPKITKYLDKIVGQKPLKIQDLERYLLLVNDLAGITSQNVLRPSDVTPGASELVVVAERKAIDAFLSYDNYGSDYQGPERAAIGANFNSMTGIGEKITAIGMVANPASELKFGLISLDVPIGSEGLTLNMNAYTSPSEPDDELSELDTESQDDEYGISLKYPFVRSRNLNFNLEGGYRYTYYDVQALDATIVHDKIPKFFGTGYLDFIDAFSGSNIINLTVKQGVDWWADTEKGSLTSSRLEADSKFISFSGEIQRTQYLDKYVPGLSLVLKFLWQYSDEPLYSSEEFSLGGRIIGRGFNDGEIQGDKGIGFTAEFQYLTSEYHDFTTQLYWFFDSGQVWNLDDVDENTKNENPVLESAGVGMRLLWKEFITLHAEIARPTTRIPSDEDDKDPRYYFGVTFTY